MWYELTNVLDSIFLGGSLTVFKQSEGSLFNSNEEREAMSDNSSIVWGNKTEDSFNMN